MADEAFKYSFMLKQLGLQVSIKNKRVESIFDVKDFTYKGFYLRFNNEAQNNEEQLVKIGVDTQLDNYKWVQEIYKTVDPPDNFKNYLSSLVHKEQAKDVDSEKPINFYFYGSFGLTYDTFEEKNIIKDNYDEFYLDLQTLKNLKSFQDKFNFHVNDLESCWNSLNVTLKFSSNDMLWLGTYYSIVLQPNEMLRFIATNKFIQDNIDIVKLKQAIEVLVAQTKRDFDLLGNSFPCLFAFQKPNKENSNFTKFIYSPMLAKIQLN